MIIELVAINSYILAVYYSSDFLFRICIISDPTGICFAGRGKVFDFKDVFYCEKLAINHGKAIVRTIA